MHKLKPSSVSTVNPDLWVNNSIECSVHFQTCGSEMGKWAMLYTKIFVDTAIYVLHNK